MLKNLSESPERPPVAIGTDGPKRYVGQPREPIRAETRRIVRRAHDRVIIPIRRGSYLCRPGVVISSTRTIGIRDKEAAR